MKKLQKITLVLGILATSTLATNAYVLESLNSAKFLAESGIIVERSKASEYNLDSNVLRQEVAAVARWVAGISKKEKCENLFDDIADNRPNNWICYTAEALRDKKLIASNSHFNPEQKITKAEALGMMVKSAWFDYSYNSSLWTTWQEQLADYAIYKWIVWNFSDYNTFATRWWIFEAWEKSMKIIKNWKINEDWNIDIDDEIKEILWELSEMF